MPCVQKHMKLGLRQRTQSIAEGPLEDILPLNRLCGHAQPSSKQLQHLNCLNFLALTPGLPDHLLYIVVEAKEQEIGLRGSTSQGAHLENLIEQV